MRTRRHSGHNNQQMPYFNSTRNYTMVYQPTLEDIKRIADDFGKPKRYRNGFMCCCPVHQDREPSLSLFLSDKYPLGIHCYAGCDPKDIYNIIEARGLLPSNKNQAYQSQSHRCYTSEKPSKKLNATSSALNSNLEPMNNAFARNLWTKALDPANTPVETYLRARGIQVNIPSTIRYAPSMKHTETNTYWPCMIAVITRWPDRQLAAIHRTYLSHDGASKAPIEKSKMMLSSVAGGAVRLTPMGNTLMVGEGIETMFSLVEPYPDRAIWAVLSASNYYSLVLPELPFASTIIIAADNDKKGIEAAERAAEKWIAEGRTVKIALPPKNTDFNDILRGDLS